MGIGSTPLLIVATMATNKGVSCCVISPRARGKKDRMERLPALMLFQNGKNRFLSVYVNHAGA